MNLTNISDAKVSAVQLTNQLATFTSQKTNWSTWV